MKLFTTNPDNNERVELADIDLTETLTAGNVREDDAMEWSLKVAVPKEWKALIWRIGINNLAVKLHNPMIILAFTANRFFSKAPDMYIDFNDGDLKCYLDLNMKDHLTKDDLTWFYKECRQIYYYNQLDECVNYQLLKPSWEDIDTLIHEYENYIDNCENCFNYIDVDFTDEETKAVKNTVFNYVRNQKGYNGWLEEYIQDIA